MTRSILFFVLYRQDRGDVPNAPLYGRTNATAWMGKEPGSCKIRDTHIIQVEMGSKHTRCEIAVEYCSPSGPASFPPSPRGAGEFNDFDFGRLVAEVAYQGGPLPPFPAEAPEKAPVPAAGPRRIIHVYGGPEPPAEWPADKVVPVETSFIDDDTPLEKVLGWRPGDEIKLRIEGMAPGQIIWTYVEVVN